MTNDTEKTSTGASRPGVMGDGTEEQNLGQPGNPGARITEDEVKEAFEKSEATDDPIAEEEAPKK